MRARPSDKRRYRSGTFSRSIQVAVLAGATSLGIVKELGEHRWALVKSLAAALKD